MDKSMDKRHLIAPCGLACLNCQFLEENITDQIRQGISEVRDIPIEETGCKGCREEGGYCKYVKYDCKTWKCVQEKGIEFCSDCDQFPCSYLAPTFKGANFPHNMKVYNLCRIRLIGIDAWIEESANIRKHYYDGEFVVGEGPVLRND